MDEDELLAELEYEEEELAATASAEGGASFEIILIAFLTVSLLVGGSGLAASYGTAGFNKQKTIEGSFGGLRGGRTDTPSAVYSAGGKTRPVAPLKAPAGQPPLTRPGQ